MVTPQINNTLALICCQSVSTHLKLKPLALSLGKKIVSQNHFKKQSIKSTLFDTFRPLQVIVSDRYNKQKKMILIYGANGSGKSNLASAFFMLAESLRTMDMHSLLESLLSEDNESINKSDVRKKLSPSRDIPALIKDSKMIDSEEPMLIEVGFRIDGHNGRYLIETDDSHLIHERLEYVLVKNKSVYFDMTSHSRSNRLVPSHFYTCCRICLS